MKGKTNRRPIAVGVELIQDLSGISPPTEGFLRRHRHRAKTLLSDGTRTDTYVADFLERGGARDAVSVLPFARKASPLETRIAMRRQVRYGAFIATGAPLLCELIAGIIEEGESPEETARRELWEEAAIEAELGNVRQLGRPFFLVPGILTERMYAASAEVSEETLAAAAEADPVNDGSPLEEGAELVLMTLGEALDSARGNRGGATPDLVDGKSELILRRFHEALSEGRL